MNDPKNLKERIKTHMILIADEGKHWTVYLLGKAVFTGTEDECDAEAERLYAATLRALGLSSDINPVVQTDFEA